MNWFVSHTHSEPSNEELGIKPWSLRRLLTIVIALAALGWLLAGFALSQT